MEHSRESSSIGNASQEHRQQKWPLACARLPAPSHALKKRSIASLPPLHLPPSHRSLCEPPLNPSFERQAIGRSHRMGQDKPLTVTRLLMKGAPMGRGSSGLCCTCCISVLLLETCKHALPPVSV